MTRASSSRKPTSIRRWIALGVFAILILASNFARMLQGHSARPLPHHQVVTMPAFDADGSTVDQPVDIVYQDLSASSGTNAPVVLLLHGSPMKSYDLQALADALSAEFRVVAPELPGFGRSSRRVPDYSLASHARYVDQLLTRMGIDRVHVVAYSQGGGVALEMAHLGPGRIASLSMVSSIGAQEFELLGSYILNHAIHGIQLFLIKAAEILVPHFGYLDTMMLNSAYARNYFDSDMRPLRGYLEEYGGPMLVVHGSEDFLVPPGAAQETHRIVPQSELVMTGGGHIMVFTDAEDIASRVGMFISRVERGDAVVRDVADADRVAEAAEPFSRSYIEPAVGVTLLVMVLLIALSTLVSEDLACIGAGLLAAKGVITFATGAAGAFLGIFVGDLLLYWAGYHWGRAALKRAPLRWIIKESSIRESSQWFARKGPMVIITSRFVPGSRLPTYFTAGVLHSNFWQFCLYFLVASVVWAPLLVWLSMKVGQQIVETLRAYQFYTVGIVAATVVLLWLMIKIVIPLFSFKGRRMLFSRWKRITRWEYWPAWIFYPPVVVYALLLGIRYRCFTLFTAANPAIPLGGLIGESKKATLDGLQARPDLIARYELIPGAVSREEKEQKVRDFMDRLGISYPVVLKPDYGQRGLGVAVVRNDDAVSRYFGVDRPATIVQEYVPGFEFGVFYYRMPGQPRGHIYSVTEKRFPSVTGDGKHDIERLILRDPRAVCMAKFYLRAMEDQRFMVPEEDEVVPLVELGTHCRGAVFQDGGWVKTPALFQAIDELSKGYDGFYFGRYDVRTPSIDALQRGEGFKVIELNGVTSESTNIYDPNYGLFDAYAILFKQWHIAFKVGERNRRKGVEPCTVPEFFQALADYDAAPEA